MSGTYNVTLLTPIGPQSGSITFIEQNGILSGSIRAMGGTSYFENGKVEGNTFEFSGVLNVAFLHFKYNVKGKTEGNALSGTATTDSGTFQMRGIKA